MKRILTLFLSALLVLSVVACGEEYTYTGTQTLEIPIDDSHICTILLPQSLVLQETDNNTFWSFSEDVSLQLVTSTSPGTAKVYEESAGVYTTGDTVILLFDNSSLLCQCGAEKVDAIATLFCSKTVREAKYDVEYKTIEKMDFASGFEMVLDKHNFYMPVEATLGTTTVYMSSIYTVGTDWVESWVKDCSEDVLFTMMTTLALTNAGDTVVSWHATDDLHYMSCGNNVVGAKRLSGNQWYIYYASNAFSYYVQQGLTTLHRG